MTSEIYQSAMTSQEKNNRIVILSSLNHVGSEITTLEIESSEAIKQSVKKGNSEDHYFIEDLSKENNSIIYNFPVLLNKDFSPWQEATLFLLDKSMRLSIVSQRTDQIRLEASWLIEYKIYCEDNEIDMYDFSQRRIVNRPSYRYFASLVHEKDGKVLGDSINKRTKVVYEFYKYVINKLKFNIDLERVDTTSPISFFVNSKRGNSIQIDRIKRSQSVPITSTSKPVPNGFVRDEGEDLRPLTNKELDILLLTLEDKRFKTDEKLAHYLALDTGIRKQTIYTIRLRHLDFFKDELLLDDGTYLLNAGPGTGIDTKFNKKIDFYVPKELAKALIVYSKSSDARKRRDKFKEKYGDLISDEDIYLFLSPEGNCHYMAKSDPFYLKTKSLRKGNNTDNMKKKLLKLAGDQFPKDFTFHWLRATCGFIYYQHLMDLVVKGKLKLGDEIQLVQRKFHHLERSTTENYLKLFMNIDEKIDAQNRFENHLFK